MVGHRPFGRVPITSTLHLSPVRSSTWLTGIAPILTPIAAVGLVVVQIGAFRVHLSRNERQPLPADVLLLLLAAFVAVGRFHG